MNSILKLLTGIPLTPILSPSGIKVIFHFYAESDVTFEPGMTCGLKVKFQFSSRKYKSDVTFWHGDDFRYKINMSRISVQYECEGERGGLRVIVGTDLTGLGR